jgi:hypothetical protein
VSPTASETPIPVMIQPVWVVIMPILPLSLVAVEWILRAL